MAEIALRLLEGFGTIGLLLIMAIEGAAFPIPGVFAVLAYGYLRKPSITQIAVVAVAMSLTYSIASYLPYLLGRRYSTLVLKKYPKVQIVRNCFSRYGECAIALTRPFGLGNYIAYAAGMAKTHTVKYGILTFAGILPWSAATIMLGKYSNGTATAAVSLIKQCWLVCEPVAAYALLAVTSTMLLLGIFGSCANTAQNEGSVN